MKQQEDLPASISTLTYYNLQLISFESSLRFHVLNGNFCHCVGVRIVRERMRTEMLCRFGRHILSCLMSESITSGKCRFTRRPNISLIELGDTAAEQEAGAAGNVCVLCHCVCPMSRFIREDSFVILDIRRQEFQHSLLMSVALYVNRG